MVIAPFQVDQILRVYGRQLKTNSPQKAKDTGRSGAEQEIGSVSDTVTISTEGKKKQIVEKVAAEIIERITRL